MLRRPPPEGVAVVVPDEDGQELVEAEGQGVWERVVDTELLTLGEGDKEDVGEGVTEAETVGVDEGEGTGDAVRDTVTELLRLSVPLPEEDALGVRAAEAESPPVVAESVAVVDWEADGQEEAVESGIVIVAVTDALGAVLTLGEPEGEPERDRVSVVLGVAEGVPVLVEVRVTTSVAVALAEDVLETEMERL